MAEESVSLLYKIKPISDRLPSVKRPEGHVHFRTKMMWVVVVLRSEEHTSELSHAT